MGAVWLGRDEVLGREVALKKLGTASGATSADFERAEREARLAARLNHPHVVAVFDLVAGDDAQWLVMEYVAGVNLSEFVRAQGPLTPEEAAPILGQVADALAAAHAAGIVHRDVKPSNILVGPQGQVKLSDFGIARAEADASLTQTGLVTGSPAYLAPEVAAGRTATEASDVWSFGATLFHALAGHPPYDVGENLLGALYRIVHEEPPRVGTAGWLSPLCEGTMTRDPTGRWTMAQVRDFLASGPPPVELRHLPRLHALAADAHGTQVMPRVAPSPSAARAPSAASFRARRRRRLLPVFVGTAVAALLGVIAVALGPDGPGTQDPTGASSAPSVSTGDEPTATDMQGFISTYLETVTTDPEMAWTMLTPAFQEASGGLVKYTRFWSGHESATVTAFSANLADLQVTYDVDYVLGKNGRTSTDTVSLQLVFEDGTYLIDGES